MDTNNSVVIGGREVVGDVEEGIVVINGARK